MATRSGGQASHVPLAASAIESRVLQDAGEGLQIGGAK